VGTAEEEDVVVLLGEQCVDILQDVLGAVTVHH
jgi:hypothetical protein